MSIHFIVVAGDLETRRGRLETKQGTPITDFCRDYTCEYEWAVSKQTNKRGEYLVIVIIANVAVGFSELIH